MRPCLPLQVLEAYLQQVFSPETLGVSGHRVRALPGSKVAIPTSQHRQDYLQAIASLPDEDSPALFGLPANINRSLQASNSAAVVGALRAMSVSQAAAQGFHRDKWRAQLAPLLRLWEQLVTGAPASMRQGLKDAATALQRNQSLESALPQVRLLSSSTSVNCESITVESQTAIRCVKC